MFELSKTEKPMQTCKENYGSASSMRLKTEKPKHAVNRTAAVNQKVGMIVDTADKVSSADFPRVSEIIEMPNSTLAPAEEHFEQAIFVDNLYLKKIPSSENVYTKAEEPRNTKDYNVDWPDDHADFLHSSEPENNLNLEFTSVEQEKPLEKDMSTSRYELRRCETDEGKNVTTAQCDNKLNLDLTIQKLMKGNKDTGATLDLPFASTNWRTEYKTVQVKTEVKEESNAEVGQLESFAGIVKEEIVDIECGLFDNIVEEEFIALETYNSNTNLNRNAVVADNAVPFNNMLAKEGDWLKADGKNTHCLTVYVVENTITEIVPETAGSENVFEGDKKQDEEETKGSEPSEFEYRIPFETVHAEDRESRGDRITETDNATCSSYVCPICWEEYCSQLSLRIHLITHTSHFECEQCSKIFKSALHLEVHIRQHLDIRLHQCIVCKVAFVADSELKKHMESHSERGHKCDICGRAFLKKASLEEHRNLHLGIKPHNCSLCKQAFSTFQGLLWHENNMHKSSYHGSGQNFSNTIALENQTRNSKTVVENNVCGDLEENGDNVVHNSQESKATTVSATDYRYVCTICSNVYASSVSLNLHLNTHTTRYKCKHCSKTFQNTSYLERHIRQHLGIKPHRCTMCKAAFSSAAQLRRHTEIHLKLKYKCDLCERGFSSKASLETHINKHLGVRNHKCPFCTRAFLTHHGLSRHQNKNHSSEIIRDNNDTATEDKTVNQICLETTSPLVSGTEPPFLCPICSDAYSDRDSRDTHLKAHSGLFKCGYCDTLFQTAGLLKKHITVYMQSRGVCRSTASKRVLA